jgi:uncharacterized protein DUF29
MIEHQRGIMKITKKASRTHIYQARPKKLSITPIVSEYESDYAKWAHNQAKLLRKGEFSKLDIVNLIEEIEDLSKRERDKLTSHLENLLMHKLKVEYQPERHGSSWDASIKEATFKAKKALKENPSLKPKLKTIFSDAYYSARLKAVVETGLKENTFPEGCPWSLEEIFQDLEKKYY